MVAGRVRCLFGFKRRGIAQVFMFVGSFASFQMLMWVNMALGRSSVFGWSYYLTSGASSPDITFLPIRQ